MIGALPGIGGGARLVRLVSSEGAERGIGGGMVTELRFELCNGSDRGPSGRLGGGGGTPARGGMVRGGGGSSLPWFSISSSASSSCLTGSDGRAGGSGGGIPRASAGAGREPGTGGGTARSGRGRPVVISVNGPMHSNTSRPIIQAVFKPDSLKGTRTNTSISAFR